MGQKSKLRLCITKGVRKKPLPRGQAPWELTVNLKNNANKITLALLFLLSLAMQKCS
jgi:hypothetical protein